MRTYGGKQYNVIDISCNGEKLGDVNAEDSNLKNKTWTPSSALSGEGKIRFSSTDNTEEFGPAIAEITIEQAGGPTYEYSQYITLCNSTSTENIEIKQTKLIGRKILSNGKLIIELNGVYYNTLGQILNK